MPVCTLVLLIFHADGVVSPHVLEPTSCPPGPLRLMEACTWALARWADTYLFPEEDLPAPLAVVSVRLAGSVHYQASTH